MLIQVNWSCRMCRHKNELVIRPRLAWCASKPRTQSTQHDERPRHVTAGQLHSCTNQHNVFEQSIQLLLGTHFYGQCPSWIFSMVGGCPPPCRRPCSTTLTEAEVHFLCSKLRWRKAAGSLQAICRCAAASLAVSIHHSSHRLKVRK